MSGARISFRANGRSAEAYLVKPASPDRAGKLMMSLRIDEAARDLAGAIDYVVALPEVTSSNVGTIGSCDSSASGRGNG